LKADRYIGIAAFICCAMLLMPGCSTSMLVNKWSDASYHGPTLTKLFIVAVRRDPVRRRVWEDVFTEELAKRGVNAVQSYRLFPQAVPDSSQMDQAVAQNNFDGIIITRRLPKTVTTNYVKGYVTTESDIRYSRRKQAFQIYYRDVEHPGYVDTFKIANRSIDVWTTDSMSRMIWSAVSATPEPATADAVHHDVVNQVAAELEQKGIIPQSRKEP
jgi:hypothetical protein